MKAFNAILGVLSIFGALYCVFWPDVAFLNAGWIVALISFLWGSCMIITHIIDLRYYHKNDGNITSGIFGIALGAMACILSILASSSETIEAVFLVLILILLMAFLIFSGIKNIIDAIEIKHSKKPKQWAQGFVFGVVQFVLALIGILNWIFATKIDDFTGILIGLMLLAFGLTLIATIFSQDKFDRWGGL